MRGFEIGNEVYAKQVPDEEVIVFDKKIISNGYID
jgi:hypothetical protein